MLILINSHVFFLLLLQNSVNEEEWNKRVALEHPQYNRLLSLRNVGPKEVSLNTANTLSSNTIEVMLLWQFLFLVLQVCSRLILSSNICKLFEC